MTTNELRELAGVSPVIEQSIPTDYNAGKKKDEARLHRREAKELRLLNNSMIEYKQGELVETLGNPRDIVMKQLRNGDYKTITSEEALHTPYRRAS